MKTYIIRDHELKYTEIQSEAFDLVIVDDMYSEGIDGICKADGKDSEAVNRQCRIIHEKIKELGNIILESKTEKG